MTAGFKKNIASLLRRCIVFDNNTQPQAQTIFSTLLGIDGKKITFNPPLTPALQGMTKDSPAGIHCAVSTHLNLETMVASLIPQSATAVQQPEGHIFFCTKSHETSGSGLRIAATELDILLQLTLTSGTPEITASSGIHPIGLLGWGALQHVEDLPAGTDPVRMLTHLNRTLRVLHVGGSKSDLVRAAIANLIHGNSATRIQTATDGESCFVEVEFEQADSPLNAAKSLARWLDGALNLKHPNAVVWIQSSGPGAFRAGIVAGSKNMPSAVILDLTDPVSRSGAEPAVESKPQTGYNVA